MFKPISLSAVTLFVMFGVATSTLADEVVELNASHDASQLLPLQEGQLSLEYDPERLDSTSHQVNQTVNPENDEVLQIPLVDEIMNGGESGEAGIRAWGGSSGVFSVGIGSDL